MTTSNLKSEAQNSIERRHASTKRDAENLNSVDLLTTGPLLTAKELAWQLKHHPTYVYRMRRAGFPMPANRTTLAAALDWIARNPDWRKRL